MSLIAALIWATAQPARAQELTAQQQEILRTAIGADGWLTEGMHQEFWAAVPLAIKSDPKAIAALTSYLDRSSVNALRFQRATWSSIKLTLAAKRVTKTPDYETAKEEIRASSLPQERVGAERGVRNADAMLEAAATGRSMSGPNGPFYVTEEMTEQVLAGLSGSFHRYRKLSNPTWIYKPEEHSYPNEHIRILWDGPFARETQTITMEGGKSVPITLLTSRISEHEHVALGFMRFQGRWLDPEGASIRTVAATLTGMGIRDVRPMVTRWRGRVAAEGAGSVRSSAGAINASVRIVEAPEHGGAWQIMAISASSLADAISLRATVEQASQFDVVGIQGTSNSDAASDCEQREDPDRKIRGCTEFIRDNPRNATAYNNRGLAYAAKKEFDRAIADYNKAIEINPRHSDAYRTRGNAYRSKGEFDRAIADYTKVIEIDPRDVLAHLARGVAYRNKGEVDRAIADYSKAIEIRPRDANAYIGRGLVYLKASEKDRAIADFRRALSLDPSDQIAKDALKRLGASP